MAEPYLPASREHSRERLAFLDPIRVGLTLLVILHHVSITFGGSGGWYYKETGAPELTQLLLTVFTATNQSFFMGFFFLIAGYLMPKGLARKGVAAYVSDRAIRLGVPILLFGYFLAPLTRALAIGAQGGEVMTSFFTLIGRSDFDLGPLWFNQALMIGTLIWVFTPRMKRVENLLNRLPGPHTGIALAVLAWAALAFVLRLAIPVGQNVVGMQIGYFASYIILFFGGAWAANYQILERVTRRHALPWLIISLISFPMLWIFAASSGAFSSDIWRGGWNVAALVYAAWEPLVATGIIVSALALFHRGYSVSKPWIGRLAKASYAAFIIHPPIAVACSWLVHDWAGTAATRFLLAGPLACLLAFVIGDALSRGLARMSPAPRERVASQPHA